MTEIGTHRERLIDHFAAFTASQREALAERWGCGSPAPVALARFVYDSPERILAFVRSELTGDGAALDLLEDLVLDHDIPLDIGWSDRGTRSRLAELGLLAPSASGRHRPGQGELPGALASVLSPIVTGLPTTLVTLLGREDDETVDRIARSWGVVGTTRLEKILTLSEWLSSPDRVEDLADRLPSPDYLGAALIALELGGICFWQEVFGHDLHENPEFGGNVVALMRSDERDYERHIAESLTDFGLIFRIDEEGQAPLAVVPDELWSVLWAIGRSWLVEGVGYTVGDAIEQAVRRPKENEGADLQATLKWFSCEAARGSFTAPAGTVSDETMSRLIEVGGHDARYWAERVDLALELSALRIRRNGEAAENPAFQRVLDLPRSAFVRQVLFDWCTGYVGGAADSRLSRAIGLDDTWRREAVRFLRQRSEFVPLWLEHEGVESELTGSGYIRNAGDSEPEQLMTEIGLTNGLVWSAKLVWLDLLSVLEDDLWYPADVVAELAQLATGFATFGQLIHVIERPNDGLYLPLQRASFLADPLHSPEFHAWFDDAVLHLLEPLGVARLSEDRHQVWLQTSHLRVESPPGLPDEQRELIMREIFGDPEMEFRVPQAVPNRLHRVDDPTEAGGIGLDLPLDVVKRWLADRDIVSFDGRRIEAE